MKKGKGVFLFSFSGVWIDREMSNYTSPVPYFRPLPCIQTRLIIELNKSKQYYINHSQGPLNVRGSEIEIESGCVSTPIAPKDGIMYVCMYVCMYVYGCVGLQYTLCVTNLVTHRGLHHTKIAFKQVINALWGSHTLIFVCISSCKKFMW